LFPAGLIRSVPACAAGAVVVYSTRRRKPAEDRRAAAVLRQPVARGKVFSLFSSSAGFVGSPEKQKAERAATGKTFQDAVQTNRIVGQAQAQARHVSGGAGTSTAAAGCWRRQGFGGSRRLRPRAIQYESTPYEQRNIGIPALETKPFGPLL
jgi:hypothetical protein